MSGFAWLRERGEHAFVMLIDDLEWERREHHQAIFERYRNAFGAVPSPVRNSTRCRTPSTAGASGRAGS